MKYLLSIYYILKKMFIYGKDQTHKKKTLNIFEEEKYKYI